MEKGGCFPVGGLHLIPLGVGDAFSARHYTTCMALEYAGAVLLLDCPHPIRKMLREGGEQSGTDLNLERVEGVALSHLHADHCCGLEDYGFYRYFVTNRKALIAAHAEVRVRLWEKVLAGGMEESTPGAGAAPITRSFDDFFDYCEVKESSSVAIGPFEVRCRKTLHSLPTTAFLVSAGGRTLGFSADTMFDPSLIGWLDQADLILHEAATHRSGMHTHIDDLNALPESIQKKMQLFHYSDEMDPAASRIPLLQQGRKYAV